MENLKTAINPKLKSKKWKVLLRKRFGQSNPMYLEGKHNFLENVLKK